MIEYKVNPLSVTGKAEFAEATKEELRTLIALIECSGKAENESVLAEAAKVSPARLTASLAFWEEAGVIVKRIDGASTITEEFEAAIDSGSIAPINASDAARIIRDDSLRGLIEELSAIMKKTSLPTEDIKAITGLYDQYGLSAEYIITLACHLSSMAKDGRLTVKRLINKAVSLYEGEILTLEALTEHLNKLESRSDIEYEIRRIFHKPLDRAPTEMEKTYVKRWTEEYGFGLDIITLASDISIDRDITKSRMQYCNKMLKSWFEAGCKTAEECAAFSEKKPEKTTSATSRSAAKEKPRYGSFDVNDAFLKALERSYGSDDE